MNSHMSNPLILAELEVRAKTHAELLAMPWSNPQKMSKIRAESQRRLSVEAQHPVLHWLTEAADDMAHSTPVSLKGEIEWLCSPWRRALWGQSPASDLIWAPAPSETDPMLQISDADPNSDDPVYDLD
jgi:hypothetical protein